MQVKKLKALIEDIQSIADALDDCLEVDHKDLDDVMTVHGQLQDQIKPLQATAIELEKVRESVDQMWIAIETEQENQ